MSHQRLLDKILRLHGDAIEDSIYPDLYSHGYSRLQSLMLGANRQWNIWHKVSDDDTIAHGSKHESLCAVLYEIDSESNKFRRRTAVFYQQPEIIDQDFIDQFRTDLKTLAGEVIYNPQTEVALSDDKSPFAMEITPRGFRWLLIGIIVAALEAVVVLADMRTGRNLIPYSSGLVWMIFGILPFISGFAAAGSYRLKAIRFAVSGQRKYRRDYAALIEKRNIFILTGQGFVFGADIVSELNERKEMELADQRRRNEEQESLIREKELIDTEHELDHREKMRIFEEMEFQMKLDDAEVKSLHLQVSTLIECTNLLKLMKESPELYEEARERFGLEHMQKLIDYAVGVSVPEEDQNTDSNKSEHNRDFTQPVELNPLPETDTEELETLEALTDSGTPAIHEEIEAGVEVD